MYEEIYAPFAERSPDTQYRDMMQDIVDNGIEIESRQGVNALTLPRSANMVFHLKNGAPVITDRSIRGFYKKPVGEILCFVNGGHTLDSLDEYGVRNFWEAWATKQKCERRGLPEGDLGPGSYGSAFHDFPMPNGGTFNQFEALIDQIRENPELRTHFVSPWIPFYNFRTKTLGQKVVVSPCHGWIKIRIIKGKILFQMMQRSGDVPVGVPSNMVQYVALMLGIALATGYEPWVYEHIILEPHIFVDQLPNVEEMLSREPRRLPTLTLSDTAKGKGFFDLQPDDYVLTDYDPHPAIKGIPVAT
jgi:thymidylate synthase